MVRSKTVARMAAAITATVIAQLTDNVLDSIGLSKEKAGMSRGIIKAVTATAGGLLVEKILASPDSADVVKPD